MNEQEKSATIARYNARLDQFGHDPRTLGWSKLQHQLRYEVLLSQWDVDGKDLLDFGCGFGDLFQYCRSTGRGSVHYHGIDINPRLIEEGKAQYPDADLIVCDALSEGFPRAYDFVLASGLFNFRLQDNWAFIVRCFELFAASCREGFSSNFMSNKIDFEDPALYYADPCRVLELCYRFSRRIVLRQDYMPFEFSVFVDLRQTFDKRSTVYPEYLGFIPNATEQNR